MIDRHLYTEHHPRWFRTHVSTYWWLTRRSYLMFILREVTSLFVAWFVVYLLWLVRAVAQGASAYDQFLEWSAGPAVLLMNLVTVFFIGFHAITWFNLAPQAIVVRFRGRRLPETLITASNYAAWAAASALVAWVILRT